MSGPSFRVFHRRRQRQCRRRRVILALEGSPVDEFRTFKGDATFCSNENIKIHIKKNKKLIIPAHSIYIRNSKQENKYLIFDSKVCRIFRYNFVLFLNLNSFI